MAVMLTSFKLSAIDPDHVRAGRGPLEGCGIIGLGDVARPDGATYLNGDTESLASTEARLRAIVLSRPLGERLR